MATFTEETVPYEFLVRWDQSGNIAGAHIGFRTVTKRDGVVIADQPLPVQPVAMAGATGFPLDDVISDITAGSLNRIAELEAQLAACRAVHP